MEVELLAGLIVLTIMVNEVLKTAARSNRPGLFKCRVCGEWMEEVSNSWAYQLPFEIWASVAKYNLKPQIVRRFMCPQKHTMTWYLPQFGDRACDVQVTKSLRK